MLEVTDLHISYGGIHAVKGISFAVPDKSIVSLIGANGAGKSSTLNAMVGLIKATGSMKWDGNEMLGQPTYEIIKKGIVLSPEGRRVFGSLTVYDNLLMGAYNERAKPRIHALIDEVYELFPRLKERNRQLAGSLSGGEQQMLAVGRALMATPKILLLDEPSLGLAPLICEAIFETLRKINSLGTTILLVEQNANKALELSDYSYVLETGVVTKQGAGKDLLEDPAIKAAYLGA
ncbi:MAG: ABC transporter ATP-binding protein [Clostridiales bacterium]|nr:ABC transporter ATP-binding protein [Clostridiales bacterium]